MMKTAARTGSHGLTDKKDHDELLRQVRRHKTSGSSEHSSVNSYLTDSYTGLTQGQVHHGRSDALAKAGLGEVMLQGLAGDAGSSPLSADSDKTLV